MRALITFAMLGLMMVGPREARAQAPKDLAFGFSGMSYLFESSDAVYTDPGEHLSGNFGFRLSKAFFGDRSVGWMMDTELYLGVANRFVLDVDLPNTIFGLQAFAGPVVAFGPFQTYAAVGVNRTTVGESKIVTIPGPVLVTYVAGGGISQAWYDIMEARARAANVGGDVLASVPRYQEVAAAGLLGVAYDFSIFRLTLDYIPIFLEPVRNNYRITFAVAG
jgi:hypothetical protein